MTGINRASLAIFMAALLALLIASCTNNDPIPPEPSTFIVLKSGSSLGVSAPAGSADPGTTVSIATGGTGSGTAAADGSVAFNAIVGDGPLSLNYIKVGQPLINEVTVAPLESLVSNPLFSTGSAPNDMELESGNLFISNSLDNTVVQYGFDGTVVDTAVFPQFASPSFLTIADGKLYVVTNGDNTFSAFSLGNLGVPLFSIPLEADGAAFIGAGKPAVQGGFAVRIPRADILSFGPPSEYGDNTLEEIEFGDSASPVHNLLGGSERHNGIFAINNPVTGEVYVVSAGELQYDENFAPHATTNSYITIIDENGIASDVEHSINLGQVGAASLAISADGTTGYLGNLVDGNVYKVDLVSGSVLRGKDDPIQLTADYTYISDVDFVPGTSLLLATSFNTDELFVIDTQTDTVNPAPYPGPFDLSLDPELLAGAIAVEVDTASNPARAYVLLSVANAVARVDLLQ